MDRVRAQPAKRHKRALGITATVVVVAGLAWVLVSTDPGTRRVDRSSLRIATVKQGDLGVEVGANGVLLPSEVEWLASQVEGRVSVIHKRAGEMVVVGQPVVELSNPELVNAAEEALSELEGANADLISYRVDLQNQLLNQKSITLRADFAFQSALLKLDAETQLRKKPM